MKRTRFLISGCALALLLGGVGGMYRYYSEAVPPPIVGKWRGNGYFSEITFYKNWRCWGRTVRGGLLSFVRKWRRSGPGAIEVQRFDGQFKTERWEYRLEDGGKRLIFRFPDGKTARYERIQ